MRSHFRALGVVVILVACAAGLAILRHHDSKPAAATAAAVIPYAALGDSVAAGVGLQTYSDASACGRTNQSYPHLIAQKLNLRLADLACSGATMPAGILGSQDVNQLQVPAQLSRLFAAPKPRLVTLTDGANDVEWTTFLSRCYSSVCGIEDDTLAATNLRTTFVSNLSDFLSQLHSHYGASAPLTFVTGYYQVAPASPASCSDLSGVDMGEQAWIRQQQAALNAAIQGATTGYNFAHFVDINFTGHELCSADPWVQGLNDPAPYHPTSAGQGAYASSVEQAIKSVTGGKGL